MNRKCLFCESSGPFTLEHIIPESLGNDELFLEDEVCGACNNYFAKIEEFVLQKTVFGFWRTFLGIRSKKGRLPSVDLSQPKSQSGRFRSRHKLHTDGVGFTAHEDGSTSVEINKDSIIQSLFSSDTVEFQFVMTPKVLNYLGRFLCKIGIELICKVDRALARSEKFGLSRTYARRGHSTELWPVFHYSEGVINELRSHKEYGLEIEETIECFDFSLVELEGNYILLRLKVGTDNWVVCLSENYPTPKIRDAFPGRELSLIWYPPDRLR